MNNINAWTQSFSEALSGFWTKIAIFLPNLLATVIVVLVGLFISKLITSWIAKLAQKFGFNKMCDKLSVSKLIKKIGFSKTPSELLGTSLHFFFVLIILVAAAETLGLQRFSSILDDFVLYLPKILGALIITFIGLFLAKTGKKQTENALSNMGVEYGSSVGRVLQLLILFITFSLAIGQLEMETALLNLVFTVLIASLGIAVALALGLGTKNIAKSVISGIYAREQLMPGDQIELDDFVGNIVAVSTVNTVVENSDGERFSIPNQELLARSFKYTSLSDSTRASSKKK